MTSSQDPPVGAQPLKGVVVLDFTRFLPGPFATQMLSDLGADVIKVEGSPGGDPVRTMEPSVGFPAVNRDKRSLLVDFQGEAGREVIRRLIAKSDVLVEVSRPSGMAAWGLDYETVRQQKPDIIYCSVSAYGQSGPYRDRPSHGMNIDALAGMLTVHEAADGSPFIPPEHPYLSSLLTAHAAAMGVCAALFQRSLTGQGTYIDASCWDCAVAGDPVTGAGALNDVPMVEGFASRSTPKYAPYKTRDGRYLMVCAIETKFWRQFCALIERPDLSTAFDDPHQPPGNAGIWGERQPWVYDHVAAAIVARDLADWEALFSPTGLPVTAIKTRKEALESDHAAARNIMIEGTDAAGVAFRTPGPGLMLNGARSNSSQVPALGQQTDDVLSFAGYSPAEAAKLRADGVAGR